MTLPVPVSRKRLPAPLCDFIFGMSPSSPFLSCRRLAVLGVPAARCCLRGLEAHVSRAHGPVLSRVVLAWRSASCLRVRRVVLGRSGGRRALSLAGLRRALSLAGLRRALSPAGLRRALSPAGRRRALSPAGRRRAL